MKKIFAACLLLVTVLSACGLATPERNDSPPPPPATETVAPVKATEAPSVPPTPVSGGGYPEVVFKAREALAAKLGLSADQITVVNLEPVDWPDSCLGISKPEVMCAMVITPGYRVILRANGSDYEIHTDTKAAVVFTRTGPPFGP